MKTLVLSILVFTMAYISNAQDYVGSFVFDGYEREYEVYLPQDFQANMPLVVSLHGGTETVSWYKGYTAMHEVTDTMGFVIVYPGGIGGSWNCGLIEPGEYFPNTDDVGFISALIDTMKTKWDIDLSRVYCCGFSLGGMMSYRMAGELGHRLGAIASVSGPLFGLADIWQPIQPMPVLYMHGTMDRLCPYNGKGDFWSAQNTIDYWLENNQCTVQADTFSFPDIVSDDGCTMQRISYTSCSGESEVIHYKGINMGHSWPGTTSSITFGGEGNRNMDINANVEILNFFKNHQNPLVNLVFAKTVEIDPFYNQSLGYPLTVRSRLSNPENHAATVWAIIQGEQSQLVDSLQLFDDGLHGDGGASDNIWGNMKSISGLSADFYKVDLVTHDHHYSDIQDLLCVSPGRFTTIGPVTLENFSIVSSDTIFDPGDRIEITLTLKNNGLAATAPNIKAKIISLDELVSISAWIRTFGDIAPGESSTSDYYRVMIDDEWTGISQVPILVEITRDDYAYWIDTLYIPVQGPTSIEEIRESMTKIYPNPTENILNIEIDYAGKQGLEIEILTVTGKLIFKKEYRSINADFTEKLDLSGFAKGIYLVKVKQANAVYVGKVVVK